MCTSSVRGGCVVGWSQAREAKELKFVERQLYEDSCPMNKEDERVSDWENQQLPAPEELMPLTQTLITPHLASAFSIITQEPAPSPLEVHLPAQFTLVALPSPGNFSSSSTEAHPLTLQNVTLGGGPSSRSERVAGSGEAPASFREFRNSNKDATLETGLSNHGSSAPQYGSSPCYADNSPVPNGLSYGALERRVENCYGGGITGTESSEYGGAKKPRKQLDVEFEDADSALGLENSGEEPTVRTLKRPRLVWTPQLHKRFVDAVAHLGIKNAVPKTIMQLMNVEGLTRENVASHLQKYRLYLKRISTEGPSVSDHLFASTPVPPSLAASAHFLSNHRDNMVPLLLPLQIGSLGHGRVVGPLSAAATYASCDPFFSLARSSDQRLPSGDQVFVLDNPDRPGSPQRRILTLFPTKGH